MITDYMSAHHMYSVYITLAIVVMFRQCTIRCQIISVWGDQISIYSQITPGLLPCDIKNILGTKMCRIFFSNLIFISCCLLLLLNFVFLSLEILSFFHKYCIFLIQCIWMCSDPVNLRQSRSSWPDKYVRKSEVKDLDRMFP